MVAKERQNITGSPKVEVGEIDTRAPFQSVKDAVSLFGEGTFSGERPAIRKSRPHSAERVLAKETQLHLAQKELNKLKDQLNNAETTKAQALTELEKAKKTVEDLTKQLKSTAESKESAIKATEAAKDQVNQLEDSTECNSANGSQKQELDSRREEYASVAAELDTAKQLLRQIRQDRDAIVEAKAAAFKKTGEAGDAAKANMERAGEISKEINAVQESIGQAKLATMKSQQEQAKVFAEKDVQKQVYRSSLQESANKALALKNDINPEIAKNLEAQLAETVAEVSALQKEIENAKASDMDSVKTITSELEGAKGSLEKVVEEKSSLQNLIESLKIELENVKREHIELKEKEAETESLAGDLHVKLRKTKSELETASIDETKAKGASEEMISTVNQLLSESEKARTEAEKLKKEAEDLTKETEAKRIALGEAEKLLQAAFEEAEEAKAAEKRALDQIKDLSESTDAARASTSESGATITISREEFEALSRKVEESNMLAEMKVAAAMAQVDAVKASENEAVKKLEATRKEINEMKKATLEALKKSEMAEAAKKAVEGELRRWREREQKKAAEVASRIIAERGVVSPPRQQQQVQKQNVFPEKDLVAKRLEKPQTFTPKKVLRPNLSGIFHRKKNQVEGASQSYLPGEEPK